MKKIITPLIFLLACLSSFEAFSQAKIQVSGRIIDKEDKRPIPGVSVTSAGTTKTTDGNGIYVISVAPDASIRFSYIGFLSQTVKIKPGQTKIDIVLAEDNKSLDEVVVRGYVNRAKEITTGASTLITAKDLADNPVSNVEQLLQGKVAGLNIQNNTGAPGFRGSVQIRGLSTMNVSGSGSDSFLEAASPLYIIDGMPLDAEQASEMGFETPGPGISPLSLIPPEDIESIEVLKDAQATSLYGARGAYGVIIITTRKGNSAVPIVRYVGTLKLNTPPKLRSTLGGVSERDFKIYQILNNALNEDDLRRLGTTPFLSDSLNNYYNNSTDWQSVFYQTTYNQTHNISVDGGDPIFNYKTNFNYFSEKGIIKNTGFNRYTARMNMEYRPSKKFSLTGYLNGVMGNAQKGDGTGGILQTGVAKNGQASSLLPEPSFFQSTAGVLSSLQTNNSALTRSVQVSTEAQYRILEDLRLVSRMGYNYFSDIEDTFTPAIANNSFTKIKSYAGRRSYLYNRNNLQYGKLINDKHDFFVSLNNELSRETKQAGEIQQQRTPNDQIQGPFGYDAFTSRGGGVLRGYGDVRLVSYSGAFSYNYNRKYIIDFTYRLDGSSRSGIKGQYEKNPAIGLKWNFKKEDFFQKFNWLNAGNVRLSWGKTITPKGSLESIFGRYNINGNYNDNETIGINYDRLPNPVFKPTTTLQYNLGMGLTMFNNKLDLTFDTYYKLVDNMESDRSLSDITGFNVLSSNDAAIINYGYEFSANLGPFKLGRDFELSFVSFNAAINRDVLAKLPEEYHGQHLRLNTDQNSLQHILQRVGRNTLSNYLRINQGTYSRDSDVPIDPVTGLIYQTNGRFFQAGDPNIKDINGDYILDNNDYLITGNSQPLLVGGFSFGTRYKNWQLNIYSSYTIGRTILNNALAERLGIMQNPFAMSSVVPLNDVDIWTKPGDVAIYPNPYDYARYGSIQPLRLDQTLWAESGSYLKVNSATLSYRLNRDVVKRFGLNNLRMYVTTNNLFTISGYSGPNPEAVNSLGRDNSNGYPVPRQYTIGINLELLNGQ